MTTVRSFIIGVISVLASVVGVLPALPAVAASTAIIDGIVHAPDGFSIPDGPVRVTIVNGGVTINQSQFIDSATGAFNFTALPPNPFYYLAVEYPGTSNIVAKVGWNGSPNEGPSFAINDGEQRSFDIRLIAGATVRGTLSGAGGAVVPSPTVTLSNAFSTYTKQASVDSTSGVFTLTGVPPGHFFLVGASDSPAWKFQRWASEAGETIVALTAGEVRSAIDIVLLRSTSIGGTVRLDDGSTVLPHGGYVSATPVLGGAATFLTLSNQTTGRYDFYGLDPGSYILCFGEGAPLTLP